MESQFTWIPLYQELARLLVDWEHRQAELIACLEGLRDRGVKVTPLNDKNRDDARFLLKELDPFTFFGSFNRQIPEESRLAILQEARTLLGARTPLPDDFDGVPVVNNQRSWFVAYEWQRERDDVAKLWKVFRLALEDDPLNNPDFASAFDAALNVWGVSTNLTMGLFWIRPETFLNLDQLNRDYLDIALPAAGLSAEFYLQAVNSAGTRQESFSELSLEAARHTSRAEPSMKRDSSESARTQSNHWLVGASWSDSEPPDQTDRFLAEGIWECSTDTKASSMEKVKSINVGDQIAIKSSSTQKKNLPFNSGGETVSKMTIKARGTVVANRGDGHTLEVEWEPGFEAKEWFFFTYIGRLWHVRNDDNYGAPELSNRLIDFVWHDCPQDYDYFCERWWGDENETEMDQEEDTSIPDVSCGVDDSPYGVDDVIEAGVFLSEGDIQKALKRLTIKKNLILQGPPGVGKSFIAKKLAYAFMKEETDERVETVQFHQTYSYEDFIRGYRPLPDQSGAFGLQDAIFYTFCSRAEEDPDRDYVFIIDEINRGNLSQIFGELLMLIEADKRGPKHAVPLVYRREDESRFSVPENVYLIGLMNLADRSLAIVDYALRRRFAFVTLSPQYASPLFREWLGERDMDSVLVDLITSRMVALNQEIEKDPLLGENYQVGHSFFCPRGGDFSGLDRDWYEDVVQTEIVPLLKEYWFDDAKRVQQAQEGLMAR